MTSERSVPLVISTYRSAAPAQQEALPSGHQVALALPAALLLGAVAVAVALASRQCRWRHLRPAGAAARPVFVLSSASGQKRVPSPLRSVLVQTWSQPAPVHHTALSS